MQTQEQCLKNLCAVLEAAGSHIDNTVKVNVFLTDMENFAAINKVYISPCLMQELGREQADVKDKIYEKFFTANPKPVRTCVAVHQLPLGTDVEIELTAHL